MGAIMSRLFTAANEKYSPLVEKYSPLVLLVVLHPEDAAVASRAAIVDAWRCQGKVATPPYSL